MREKTIQVRVSEQEQMELDKKVKDSGMTVSAIVRSLITRNEVVVYEDGKTLCKDIASLHNTMNQYYHRVQSKLDCLERQMVGLEQQFYKDGMDSEQAKRVLMNAQTVINLIRADLVANQDRANCAIERIVDKNGNF